MIIDRTTQLSVDQGIRGTAASDNVLDLGDFGTAPPSTLPFVFRVRSSFDGKLGDLGLAIAVTEPFNNLTSLAIAIETATDAAFTSPIEMGRSPAYTAPTTGRITAAFSDVQAGMIQ
jgi:hypothetical protein